MLYFSVRKGLRIGNKTYIPCVCYELPKHLELTVNKLVEEGKARIHEEMVGFMNGKILVKETKPKKVTKKETVKQKAVSETVTVEETEKEKTDEF